MHLLSGGLMPWQLIRLVQVPLLHKYHTYDMQCQIKKKEKKNDRIIFIKYYKQDSVDKKQQRTQYRQVRVVTDARVVRAAVSVT